MKTYTSVTTDRFRYKLKGIHCHWCRMPLFTPLNYKILRILCTADNIEIEVRIQVLLTKFNQASQQNQRLTKDSLKIEFTSSRLTLSCSNTGGLYPFLNQSFSTISAIVILCYVSLK